MADGNFVSKTYLIAQIRQIVSARETGYLTILTDTRRSVLLRFSSGKLTHSLARTKDVGDAIQVLNECSLVRFTYAVGHVENRPELIPAETFLQLLEPGSEGPAMDAPPVAPERPQAVQPSAPAAPASPAPGVNSAVHAALIEVALEFIGPVAEMIVEEALQNSGSVSDAINYVADMIPEAGQAAAFRDAARARIPLV